MNMEFSTIPKIVNNFNFAMDIGDVYAINKELVELYNEMEHELYCICKEVNSDRLDFFKHSYFSKKYE